MKISSRCLAPTTVTLSGFALLSLMQTQKVKTQQAQPNKVAVAPLRVLVVGGGPDLDNNQVAIESNVRYLNRSLPAQTPRTVLFADGNAQSETVLFDQAQKLSRGQYLYGLLFEENGPQEIVSTWRRPQLGSPLDGASRRVDVTRAFTRLARDSSRDPRNVLLYFTGHGSQNRADTNNNFYDLWNSEQLSVRDLSGQIARLPARVPVTLVMVQCFSGAFTNLLFAGGDAKGDLIDRDIAGFFATTRFRVAAGCTSEVDEREYHDFTSYFFAALTGRDRVGRRISGADFNRDGRVGMDEAFCFTLANDKSIDVPVATSDLFLRRFVSPAALSTRFAIVRAAASPAQRAALDKLSQELKLSGEDRLAQAHHRVDENASSSEESALLKQARQRFATLRHDAREEIAKAQPNLRSRNATLKNAAEKSVQAQLERDASANNWQSLLNAGRELIQLENEHSQAEEAQEVEQSHLIRFILLHESVALRLKLQASSNAALKNRFARLLRHESSTLLPPQP
jgi:hypothetical protein